MAFPEGKYAWTVTVGEKGQFVIPKQARDVFGIHPGDTLLLDSPSRSIRRDPQQDLRRGWRSRWVMAKIRTMA